MRKLAFILVLAASASLAQAPVPRKSPEFTITRPSNEQILLSTFKGKVVVMEFMFVGSPHCIRLASMLNTLQNDLGPRGYQSIAIAFGPHSDPALVGHLAQRLNLTYPLGVATSDQVDAFLARHGSEKLKIPQIVVIDRKGLIRAATGAGDPSLESESTLRPFLTPLLSDSAPATPYPPN